MSATPKLKLDPLAASYLVQAVAEDRARLDQIAKEVEKLQAERRAIEWKIERLGATGHAKEAESPTPRSNGNASNGSGNAVRNGFADTIRKVMRDAGKGLKTKEISELILKSGFQYTAHTPLIVRVGSDLRRLVKRGVVSQRRGLYSINQVERQADLLQ
jgi:hypothetical protein